MSNDRLPRLTIGLLAGWPLHRGTPDTFLHQVFYGVHAAAKEVGCNLLAGYGISAPRDADRRHPAWPLQLDGVNFVPVGPWNCDGLIVVAPITLPEGRVFFKGLLAQGYPVVFAGTAEIGPGVVADNESGVRQAMAHLVAHGHRRIAFIASRPERIETDTDGWLRLQTYLACVSEFGLESDPALIAYGHHSVMGGRQAVRELLSRGVRFSALVASNDISAVGAVSALREAGLSVPEDVAVIGFDDRIEGRALAPQLTTVHYPMFEVGYRSLHLLLSVLNGGADAGACVRVPTHLVVRESCGCLPGIDRTTLVHEAYLETEGATSPATSVVDWEPRFIDTLATITFDESQRLDYGCIRGLCERLVKALEESLVRAEVAPFEQAFCQILDLVVARGDELKAWQSVLTTVREWMPVLLANIDSRLTVAEMEQLLHRARVAVSEKTQRQHAAYVVRQAEVLNQLNRMTSQLYVARDDKEIFAVLAESLPALGIRHAAIVTFAAEGDDPAAWSDLHGAPGARCPVPASFRTRTFPPDGLYDEIEPFYLALVPLLFEEAPSGFVAFDMGNLELCAEIAWQLVAAERSVWLYQEALEGKRLAEEASRLKSRFLSVVSHELRTPLNLISGLSDLLLRESGEDTSALALSKREDLERIYVNAQHLDSLIRDVLDLARSEVGQLQLSCERFSLADVLQPVVVIGRHLACEKGLTWKAELPGDLPDIWGDPTRLRQVALNLVNNAVKFTDSGSVALVVHERDDRVIVTVRDTGVGIPHEEQEAIFDEFRQGQHTTTRGYGGLGLGLAICKRLVTLHDGEISVRSTGKPGGGAEFVVELPVLASAEAADRSPDEELLSLLRSTHAVLLVDEAKSAHELQARLAEQDLNVVPVVVADDTDWRKALLDYEPDAVILDQVVAASLGGAVLSFLQKRPQMSAIPVLFYALDEHGEWGALLQVDLMSKPMRQSQFSDMLQVQGLSEDPDNGADPKTILIVDDDPEMLALHTRVVQAHSPRYRPLQARGGLEALEIMRREHPDLVLLDLMMPGVDGFEVLDRMRSETPALDIPVVVLTAQDLTFEDISRLNRDVVGVLSKGVFTVEETLQRVEAVLNRRRKSVSDVQRLVLTAMGYIHIHYMDAISREDIATHVGLSPRHLNRCFHKELGVTPISYLNRYRIKAAKALLETGTMTITDVAQAVGFSTGGYFARVFRQEMGIPPSDYQKRHDNGCEMS